jgi:hypothetical protein
MELVGNGGAKRIAGGVGTSAAIMLGRVGVALSAPFDVIAETVEVGNTVMQLDVVEAGGAGVLGRGRPAV